MECAVRHALPALATDALRILRSRSVPFEEYHYVALMEAYLLSGEISSALAIFNIMRSADIPPTRSTMKSYIALLDRFPEEKLDQILNECIVQPFTEERKLPDICALDGLLAAYANRDLLKKAFAVYKLYAEVEYKPSVETFNYLFSGCAIRSLDPSNYTNYYSHHHRHPILAPGAYSYAPSVPTLKLHFCNFLYSEMRELCITPNMATYEYMALTSLNHAELPQPFLSKSYSHNHLMHLTGHQSRYPHRISLSLAHYPSLTTAFHYLSQLKSLGFRPRQWLYRRFVEVCLSADDDRVGLLLDEMENRWGYAVDVEREGVNGIWTRREAYDKRRGMMVCWERTGRVIGIGGLIGQEDEVQDGEHVVKEE